MVVRIHSFFSPGVAGKCSERGPPVDGDQLFWGAVLPWGGRLPHEERRECTLSHLLSSLHGEISTFGAKSQLTVNVSPLFTYSPDKKKCFLWAFCPGCGCPSVSQTCFSLVHPDWPLNQSGLVHSRYSCFALKLIIAKCSKSSSVLQNHSALDVVKPQIEVSKMW